MNIENQNQTLESLLEAVRDQSARKQDYITPTDQLQVSTAMGPDEVKLQNDFANRTSVS